MGTAVQITLIICITLIVLVLLTRNNDKDE